MAPQTINLPYIEAGEVFGPTLAQPQTINLPYIESGIVFAPMVLTESAAAAGLEVLVNGTLVDGTFARSWEDQLADTGSFSFSMLRLGSSAAFRRTVTDGVTVNETSTVTSATAAFTDADRGRTISGANLPDGTRIDSINSATSVEITELATGSGTGLTLRIDAAGFDSEVTFRLDGVPTFLGIVKGIDHTALAQGEEADQVVTISGLGMLAAFGTQVVYPSRGVGALPIEDVRSLSWVSPDFDPEDAGWPLAKVVNYQRSYADTGAPRPTIFPNTDGKWIWGNVAGVNSLDAPQGINLFRQWFSVGGSTRTVRFFFAGDNVMRIWIDAAEMTWFAGSAVGRYVDIELSGGTHVIAAKVANKVDVPGEDNPAGFILAGYTTTADGLLDDLIVETDANWLVMPYPVRAPGFTDGRAMSLLMDEPGVYGDWTRAFTDTRTTKGNPWTYQREIAANVGRTLLDYQRERMDAYADIACAPGAKVLRMWNRGERGTNRGVTLQQTSSPTTSDFLALSHQGKSIRAENYLIRYADGHTEQTIGFTSDGDVTAYLELGIIESEAEALTIAAAQMENRSTPSYSTAATIFPRSDATTPYKGFEVGDWITVPNEDDENELMRVNSIAYTEDDQGEVEWAVTLRDFAFSVEERHDAWLRRMADGTAVGGARVSSRKETPASSAQQISVLKVAEFSFDNSQITTGLWPERPAEESGNIIQVIGRLTTAGSSTTTIAVTLNGSTLGTLSFPSGVKTDDFAVDIEKVIAHTDYTQINCTAAGTGAAGLVVEILAI